MQENILQIQNLRVSFGSQVAVNGISFDIPREKTVALVGESGSGKSVTAMSILGLLSKAANVTGKIWFENNEIVENNNYKSIRGRQVAMVFQEPMTSLNPVFTIGEQIEEVVRQHHDVSKKEVRSITIERLNEVGISSDRVRAYPHEFSGGMRQRVMIAMALASEPSLLIADEPTTALDASTSKQIVELINQVKISHGMSVLFITHDLGLVSAVAEYVCVMKGGTIVESGRSGEVLMTPKNEYTRHLLECRPVLSTGYSQ
ncbi:MAG: ABC transporter ATP-binding protein [Phycisphaerales bacterium]|jgi:ABC-type dipeptide/oligopeptide/nickel transport system ATPase component|nr:ABC transporter ATP-binding protein [Phycisphaerales bacterium]